MSRCPNCNYELVLISHKQKYKCPKFSKLFSQKEIDTLEFHKFNKLERQKDKDKTFGKPQPKQTQLSLSRFTKKEDQKSYRLKNQDTISTKKANYYEKNKDKILTQQRNYRKKSGQVFNERERIRRLRDVDGNRQKTRIKFWRNEQKALALKVLENRGFSLYKDSFSFSLPTYSLSYLLF